MDLSPLEDDLLGDLAQDRHGIWEVFEFVRLHYPDAREPEVGVRGHDLITQWLARGWLQAEREDGTPLDVTVLEQAIGPDLQRHQTGPVPNAPWLALTARAKIDVPWIGPAA
jgi:hypothetical protein